MKTALLAAALIAAPFAAMAADHAEHKMDAMKPAMAKTEMAKTEMSMTEVSGTAVSTTEMKMDKTMKMEKTAK